MMLDIWMRSIARAGGVEVPHDRPILTTESKELGPPAKLVRQRDGVEPSGFVARLIETLRPARHLRPRGCDGL